MYKVFIKILVFLNCAALFDRQKFPLGMTVVSKKELRHHSVRLCTLSYSRLVCKAFVFRLKEHLRKYNQDQQKFHV